MVLYVFRQHRDLRLEQVVAGMHRFELRDEILDHLMLDCRLVDHVGGLWQLADRRIKQLLLDLRVHRESAADGSDQRRHLLVVFAFPCVLELIEEIFDRLMVPSQ